jgi:transcriptional regulator with XRE-family HTH domain
MRQLAIKMGVNHLWISRRIGTMQTEISPEDIELLADALGLPVWKLLPPEWLPRLDSNQQPAGYPAREHFATAA